RCARDHHADDEGGNPADVFLRLSALGLRPAEHDLRPAVPERDREAQHPRRQRHPLLRPQAAGAEARPRGVTVLNRGLTHPVMLRSTRDEVACASRSMEAHSASVSILRDASAARSLLRITVEFVALALLFLLATSLARAETLKVAISQKGFWDSSFVE